MRRAALAALLVLAVLAGVVLYGLRAYDQPGPLPSARAVMVPHGGTDEVAEALARDGIISSPRLLHAAALATRGDGAIRAGELEFPAAASLHQVLQVLRAGKAVQHRVTIPEGLTAAQVGALLDRTPILEGGPVLPDEGGILPETYAFERGTTRAEVMSRASHAMSRTLDRAWAARNPALPLDTPRDVLILASIVERETAKPEERPRIAAVFLNRLRQGMKLQSDPTVVYGASGGTGVLDHSLTRAELDRNDPYNTYRIPGLPPGPISMPGAAALRAVTQPAQTDELYFVADGTGGHVFARTQEEHLRNVARWREIERVRRQP